jgi:hypothetical protein
VADERTGDVVGRQGQGCGVQVMFKAGMSLIASVRAFPKALAHDPCGSSIFWDGSAKLDVKHQIFPWFHIFVLTNVGISEQGMSTGPILTACVAEDESECWLNLPVQKRKQDFQQPQHQSADDEVDTSRPSAVFTPTGGRQHTLTIALPGSVIAK